MVEVARTAAGRALDDLLVDLCGGVASVPADGVDADALASAVRYHRIAPLAHVALRGTRPDLAEPLRQDRDRAVFHHLRATAVLGQVDEVLDGIPWVAVKGPVLSEFAHPVHGIRSYRDLDVVVAPASLRRACERLFDVGWRVIDTVETLRHPSLPGEIVVGNEARLLVDLHWAMVHSASLRERFRLPTEAILERRVAGSSGRTRIWHPDPADSLIHVCLHAALAGATRLLHVLDADQLARQVDDWDAVVRRAREWGATATTAVVLGRARSLFGTPVPADLRRMLGLSAGFAALTRAVDRGWPVSGVRADSSMPRRVSMGIRDGAAATALAVVRNSVAHFGQTLRQPDPQERLGRADPATVAAYLDAVDEANNIGH